MAALAMYCPWQQHFAHLHNGNTSCQKNISGWVSKNNIFEHDVAHWYGARADDDAWAEFWLIDGDVAEGEPIDLSINTWASCKWHSWPTEAARIAMARIVWFALFLDASLLWPDPNWPRLRFLNVDVLVSDVFYSTSGRPSGFGIKLDVNALGCVVHIHIPESDVFDRVLANAANRKSNTARLYIFDQDVGCGPVLVAFDAKRVPGRRPE